MSARTGLVERLTGTLLPSYPLIDPAEHEDTLTELLGQLRPFWHSVKWSIGVREDGLKYVHYWQPARAPGGELQLYLEPTSDGRQWVCVVLDNHALLPIFTTHAAGLRELVDAVCAALGVGLRNWGIHSYGTLQTA